MFKDLCVMIVLMSLLAIGMILGTSKLKADPRQHVYQVTSGLASGTGTVIKGGTELLTAAHVILDPDSVYIFVQGNRVKLTVKKLDRAADVAVLTVPHGILSSGAVLSCKNMSMGEPASHIGFPLALPKGIYKGVVSTDPFVVTGKSVQLSDVLVAPGSSGGAVFDSKGVIRGIFIAVLEKWGHSVLVPASVVCHTMELTDG